uniref:DUF4283 domain-containing protein n=1 Tax=Quercus lobata TaxID=97700 RepID=A0A7N2MLB3_QUELO
MEHSLSHEEKEELVRSKKKVKVVSHAGFCDGHSSGPVSPSHAGGLWNSNASFKDKLVGEIPGAFSQAFSFEDGMDDDAELDGEVETLQQGLLSVKLFREFKQKIRRLDYLDLGHGFFLTRLSLGKDYENVLQKGPWFIGDHFLSIRPQEPNFKPTLASVSSITVWVRLNELPLEYYNAEALQIIENAIGRVLNVDTFMASETRGRFARMCANGCGEPTGNWHTKEQCPHIIRQEPSVLEMGVKEGGDTVVVAHRKNRTKQMKSDGISPKQSTGFNFKDNDFMERGSLDRAIVLHQPTREAKRKLSPSFLLDRAQITSVVQSLRSEGKKQAHSSPTLNFNNDGTNHTARPLSTQKNQRLSSVKRKKGATRNRFSFGEQNSAIRGQFLNCVMPNQPLRNAESVGSDGQHRSPEAGSSEKAVQFQKQEAVEGKGEDREATIPESGLGSSYAMQCEASERPDGTKEFGGVADKFCHDEVQVNHSLGGVLPISDGGFAAHDPSVFRNRLDRMVLEGGVVIEEPQC